MLRMMVDLAEHQNNGYLPSKILRRGRGISEDTWNKLSLQLNRSDILRTNRGFQGGYSCRSCLKKYTVGDILRITEGVWRRWPA